MKDLIRFEFRKLRTQKSFYICLAVMIVMILITGITYKVVLDYMPETAEAMETEGGEVLPKTFSGFLLGFVSASMFSMLTSIFVSIVVCDDYDNQIVKNIYARGYSRENCYFAKLIYVFAVTTVMFLVAIIFAGVIGGAFFGFNGVSGKMFILLGGQYVVCISGVALSFAIAAAIRKLGATIAVNIILPMIIPLLLGLADTVLKINGFKIEEIWVASFLTSFTNIETVTGRIIACVLGSVAYTAAFIAAGYAVNRKTEI